MPWAIYLQNPRPIRESRFFAPPPPPPHFGVFRVPVVVESPDFGGSIFFGPNSHSIKKTALNYHILMGFYAFYIRSHFGTQCGRNRLQYFEKIEVDAHVFDALPASYVTRHCIIPLLHAAC